jgi:uncharacterized protein (TIGR02466 family)
MPKSLIFNQCILHDEFINSKVDNEIYKILSKEEKNKNGNVKSNLGGFQTKTVYNEFISESILTKSVDLIKANYKLKRKIRFFMKNLWINKNKKNNFNLPHIHPSSSFSGIYYLKVPKNNGELVFLEKDNSSMSDLITFIDSNEFSSEFIIKPKKGLFLLFPSYCSHMVKPHFENLDRISISFNIGLS